MRARILKVLSVVCLTMTAVLANAQPLPKGPGRETERETLKVITPVSGKLESFTYNKDFTCNGFLLSSGNGKMEVKFPPHLAKEITMVAKAGSTVTVSGTQDINLLGVAEMKMVSLTVSGRTINDTPPAIPVVPTAENSISGSGKIASLQKTAMGDTSGFILDDKTILKIPQHMAQQLNQLLQVGSKISYSGNLKTAQQGEVVNGNYKVVHCQTVSVNGTQYLVR